MTIVAYSLFKELQHLKSDLFTINSLPIPVVSAFSPQMASRLAKYGIDTGNIVKVSEQASMAIFINCIIGMLHGFLYKPAKDESERLYSVRTQKIIATSNVIASGVNIAAIAIAMAVGVKTGDQEIIKKSANYIDVGGYIETIHQVVKSKQLQEKVRREYLEKELFNELKGSEYTFL